MLARIRRWLARDRGAPPETAAAAGATDAGALLEPACAALVEHRTGEAIRMLERIVWAHPQLAEGHRLLAEALRQQGDIEEARDSYTLALHFDPASWRAHYGLAVLELGQKRPDVARGELELALVHGGDNGAVRNALGAAHVECGDTARAVEHFRRAIALDPDNTDAHSNLGYLLFGQMESYAEGAALVDRAIALGAQSAKARLNWAMVLQLRGEVDRALEVYDELLDRDPDFAQARLNRGLILLARGDFERGWTEYEARKETPGFPQAAVAAPEWDGSDLSGKRIAIYPEQGLGDEIMFASCVPDVLYRARSATLVCHPKLERLYRRSFPAATVLAQRDGIKLPAEVDWSARIGSLPRFLRSDLARFPAHDGYLRADPERVRYWRERLAALPGKRKVGIAWRGGLPSTRRNLRSIPLAEWDAVLGVPDVDFVSLQHTDCADEIAAAEESMNARVHHWPEALADYDETAALVSALDLVVSVQTAMVHLCGALGVPAWALIPETPEWRYGESGESMPWYPSVRLVRKAAGEAWPAVIARVAQRLAAPDRDANDTP